MRRETVVSNSGSVWLRPAGLGVRFLISHALAPLRALRNLSREIQRISRKVYAANGGSDGERAEPLARGNRLHEVALLRIGLAALDQRFEAAMGQPRTVQLRRVARASSPFTRFSPTRLLHGAELRARSSAVPTPRAIASRRSRSPFDCAGC